MLERMDLTVLECRTRGARQDCTAGGEMNRLIVGISGATGIIYGVRLLEELHAAGVETHLVTSRAGEMTRAYETPYSAPELRAKADVSYPIGDVGAAIASGSFRTRGMIIAPCSMRTLAEIATGVTTSLLTRAADVCLKERRRVVLLVRETPLTTVHLRNMLAATEAGAIIFRRYRRFTIGRPPSTISSTTPSGGCWTCSTWTPALFIVGANRLTTSRPTETARASRSQSDSPTAPGHWRATPLIEPATSLLRCTSRDLAAVVTQPPGPTHVRSVRLRREQAGG